MNDIIYVGKHLRTYQVARHSHDTWELIYCTGGEGKFLFDGFSISYGEGETVLIPPQLPHANDSEIGFTNIHLNLANASLPFDEPGKLADDSERHLKRAFETAFYFFNSELPKKQLVTTACGHLIANLITAYTDSRPLNPLVETIKSNIVQNFPDSQYKLDEYLRSFAFNYDYLRKLFKSETGVTPHTYLTNIRMETAEKMLCTLRGDDNNITKVAHSCGFEEPLYFSRVFKNHYGCSPLNYVKRYRQAVREREAQESRLTSE